MRVKACNAIMRSDQVLGMSIPRAATGSLHSSAGVSADGAVAEFEVVYRANVAGVSAFCGCGETCVAKSW